MAARDDLIRYAASTRTVTADGLAPYIARVELQAAAHSRAEAADRATENRELRLNAMRAVDLIAAGQTAQAVSLLRSIARSVTT
ncbi:hypothetical protein ACIQ7D_17725 [Streptomyces sp. NPDC096310]|uniref:hypothetical protein n=1 Tax=Streptomyces sp. NPDC096310 TaxID=3366082 RepID=UPI0037FD8261